MRGLEVAREHGLEQEIARAHNDLAIGGVIHRAHALADAHIAAGLGHCADHDLDLWTLSMLGMKVRSELNQGRFDEASEIAIRLAGELRDSPAPRFEGLLVLATVRARRGDPGVRQALEQAAGIGFSPDEHRLGRGAGDRSRRGGLAGRRRGACRRADLACARARARAGRVHSVDARRARVLAAAGGYRRAGSRTRRRAVGAGTRRPPCRGCRSRLASAGLPVRVGRRARRGRRGDGGAHRRLQELGAGGAAAVFARRLRRRGVRGSPAARGRARARTRRI